MSWDVYVVKDGKGITMDRHEGEGGTYVDGGTDQAELNITYNYGRYFFETLGCSFVDLSGRPTTELIPMFEKAVKKLGTKQDEDYWKKTPGNAGHALAVLLGWCRQAPAGAVLEVS